MLCVVRWKDCCCSASKSPESKGDGEETHDLLRKSDKKQGEEHEMDLMEDEDSKRRHPNQDVKTE